MQLQSSAAPGRSPAAVYQPAPSDNGAALSQELSSVSGPVAMSAGAYAATTTIIVPSNAALAAAPATTIASAVPTTTDFNDCSWITPKVVSGAATTLSTDLVLDSSTFAVASITSPAIVVGSWLSVYAVDTATLYKVLALNSGTKTITTDRPIEFKYASGTAVYVQTPTTNAYLNYGGATLTIASGHRGLWLPGGVDGGVSNVTIYSSCTVFCYDRDLGSLRCRDTNIKIFFVANTSCAAAIEGGTEGNVWEDFTVEGAFQTGFQVSGRNVFRNLKSGNCVVYGLSLQESGAADVFAAVECEVWGGEHRAVQNGVSLRSNSNRNLVHAVKTSGCSVAGFIIATGSATSVIQGASYNLLAGCKDERSAISFVVGDGATIADGNALTDCESAAATTAAFLVQTVTTNTRITGGAALGPVSPAPVGTAVGYTINASATLLGCRSSGMGGRALVIGAGTVEVIGFDSVGDGASGTAIAGLDAVRVNAGSLLLTNARLTQAAAAVYQWNGVYHASTGASVLTNVIITMVSANTPNVGVYAVAAGSLKLRDVVVTGTGTGNVGLYVAAGTVEIGPGCSFDAMATPLTIAGGTVTMVQTGGVAAVSATATLTFTQHYCTAIELASGASADSTITTYPIPGMTWVARNLSAHNLILETTNAGTITVAAGKSAIVAVNNAGVMTRVSPDT